MASSEEKEIEKHLRIALTEIGEIKPWFSKGVKPGYFSMNYIQLNMLVILKMK